ncbi:DEKNAAC104124 [Brettanomyces naardenensis]|uniref:non-specific serine/threonine protein kinase n=1 Tax=Brettanomyces naardenensis TaxID=13370 RepID=A0A448YQ25_BRENA|nr:DEKNAAC104124 [Brettanomyces naardenensis]
MSTTNSTNSAAGGNTPHNAMGSVLNSVVSSLSLVSLSSTNNSHRSSTDQGTVHSGESISTGGSSHVGLGLRRFLGGRARRKKLLQDKLKGIGEKVEQRREEHRAERKEKREAAKSLKEKQREKEKEKELAILDVAAAEAEIQEDDSEVTAKLVSEYGEICHKGSDPNEELVLGQGAGGAVLLVKRPSDGHLFAVKKFLRQNFRESLYEYRKRLEDEYRIAAAIRNPNLVRTYELLRTSDEKLFAIVMDYCPYDFFAMVMAGIMSRKEIYCYFKQMVKGVQYMHHNGFAHRDLKLDNCVVTKEGILKIVDFGSVAVFDQEAVSRLEKKENEDDDEGARDSNSDSSERSEADGTLSYSIIKARGVAGSDPYLAPECLALTPYDPRAADVWSLAIVFCCVILRRFPWKIPRNSDGAYKAFIAAPSETVDAKGRKRIFGPDRLLRALPSKTRPVIGKMLSLNPDERITIDQVAEEPFVKQIEECYVEQDGAKEIVVNAQDHTHHLMMAEEIEKMEQDKKVLEKEKKDLEKSIGGGDDTKK